MTSSNSAFTREYTRLGVAIGAVVVIAALNQRPALTSIGPVTSLIVEDTGLSESMIGLVAALPLVVMGLAAITMPKLARRFTMDNLVIASLFGLAAATIIRSWVPGAGLWIGTIGVGAAIGLLNALLPAIIKRDFPMLAATVTGIYSAALTAGAAFSAGFAYPIAQATTWRAATGIWSVLALLGVLAWTVIGILRAREQKRFAAAHRASTVPDGAAAPGLATPGESATSPQNAKQPTAVVGKKLPHLNVWKTALGWQVTLFTGMQSLTFYLIVQWLPAIEAEAGVSPESAGTHLMIFQSASLVSNLLITGIVRERRDQRLLAFVMPIMTTLVGWGFFFAPTVPLLWVTLAGLGAGGSFVTALSFISTRTSNSQDAAELSGMSQSLGYIIAALGPAVAGSLATAAGSWTPVLLFMMAMGICTGLVGYFAGRNRTLR